MVLDDNAAAGSEHRAKSDHEPLVYFKAFAVNDVGKKNYIVAAGEFINPVITADQPDSAGQTGFSHVTFGECDSCRQIENGGAEIRKSSAKRDGIGGWSRNHIEQLVSGVPIEGFGHDLRIAARLDKRIHRVDKNSGFRGIILIHVGGANRVAPPNSLGQ